MVLVIMGCCASTPTTTTLAYEGTTKKVSNCTSLPLLRVRAAELFPDLHDMVFEMVDKDGVNWNSTNYTRTLQQNHELTVTIRRLTPFKFEDPQWERLASAVFRLMTKNRVCIAVGFMVSPTHGVTSWEALKREERTGLTAHFDKLEPKEVEVNPVPLLKINEDKPQALALITFKDPQLKRAFIRLDRAVNIAEGEPTTALYPEKEGDLPVYVDTCEYKGFGMGATGTPVFNKRRELLGMTLPDGKVMCTPGIVKNVEAALAKANKDEQVAIQAILPADNAVPDIIAEPETFSFQPTKQEVQAEAPKVESKVEQVQEEFFEDVHEEAIAVLNPAAHAVQASAPREEPQEPAHPPPALFGYLLDLAGRRVVSFTRKGKLEGFTKHDHRFNEGISCVFIPEGLLITGPDPNGMQNAAIFNKTSMTDITCTIRPRQYHTSVYFQDHALVISGIHTACVERLMSDHSWEHVGTLPEKRSYAASCVQGDFVYLLGGVVGDGSAPNSSILRSDGLTWTRLDLQLPFATKGAGCAVLDDKILLYGGEGNQAVYECNFHTGICNQVMTASIKGNTSGLQAAVFERETVVISTDTGNVYIFMPVVRQFLPTFDLASAPLT